MVSEGLLRSKVVEMVSAAAIYLADDVKEALRKSYEVEDNPLAKKVFESILDNVRVAEEEGRPLCQDTGTLIYYVKAGDNFPLLGRLPSIIRDATIEATASTPLRPNAVDVITGENSGDNTGERIPWVEWEIVPKRDGEEITVVLKGGGSESSSLVKVIPPCLGIEGALKIVVDDIFESGAKICPPVVVGVGLGPTGDVAMSLAKKALLRPISDRNPRKDVAVLEDKLLEAINALGWGPHGVGGRTTALDVHIEVAYRHPATLAVGVATNCWASRTSTMRVTKEGVEFLTHRFLNR
ncbi:MAG: fumarate hydratase [Candidatus Bathyarchaeia archaeon]